nr:hypothetical protein [Tanacetum cinerariifolium]
MVQAQEEIGEGTYILTDPPSTSQPLRKQKPRKTKRKDTQVPQLSVPLESIADEAVSEEMNDRLVRVATTASSIEVDQNRVHTFKAIKTTQAQEIDSLKIRVKKLEKNQRSRTHKLKRLYKVGLSTRVKSSDDEGLGEEDASKQERIIDDLDADEDITLLVLLQQLSINDITLAKALEALKTSKPKIRGIVIKDHEEPSKSRTTTISSQKSQGKERLQAEEQQELNEEAKAKLFMELLEKRRKFFAAKSAEENGNRPPTKAQERSIMCTYLKNMEGYKLNSLKNKFFADIQDLFDKAMKRVNTFVDYTTELVEESSKKAEAETT